jgi:hypothetical protein
MSRNLRLASLARGAALSTAVLVAAALGTVAQPGSANAAQDSGYFAAPDASLVPPTLYNTGNTQATTSRQQASGYFATAGAPLVEPTDAALGDRTTTLSRQQASGYFPTAGAPLYAPASGVR